MLLADFMRNKKWRNRTTQQLNTPNSTSLNPMQQKKRAHPEVKSILHPRNKHRKRYDFEQLILSSPDLAPYVNLNAYNDLSIDFFNPEAVKMLNRALLKHFYAIANWDIPPGYLCPPIPGRADYIHYIADLLGSKNEGIIPKGAQITCLDIGVGANCVYPIIGNKEYGWSFTGSDIDPVAIESAKIIIKTNPFLKGKVDLRLQQNSENIFNGIIRKGEKYDVTICNPPFHASLTEAQTGSIRKLNNLTQKNNPKAILNFGGQTAELWCKGGEEGFVKNMINESKQFAASSFWFTTLISKEANLKSVHISLRNENAVELKTIPMGQGNKISRVMAWTFLSYDQQVEWKKERWNK